MNLPGKPVNTSLLWRSAWRYAMQHRWQSSLNILGITIGVMMVVAVDLANNSARQAFTSSIEILNGNITHQIVAGSDGIPDALFTRLKTELGIRRAAPTISGRLQVNDREMTLVGIDVISEMTMARQRPGVPQNILGINGNLVSLVGTDDAVVIEESLASSLGIQVGGTFDVETSAGIHSISLAATFNIPEDQISGDIILGDIATAQSLLGRKGTLDSIDLVLSETEISPLQNWLPSNLALVNAQSRTENVEQMSNAFYINLLAMSLLSLLVAGLLIYNTVTLSVIQRQQTLAIFRAQGVTGKQLFSLVMLENACAGLLASLLGVVAGFILGSYLVVMVTGTVDALYYDLSVSGFMVEPWVLGKGLALGVILSLLSAALPAWHAATCKPVTLHHQAAQGSDWQQKVPWLAAGGAALMGAGWLMLLPEYGSLVIGFVSLTLIVFGFCLLVPFLLIQGLRFIQAAGTGFLGLSGMLALRNTRSAINRTGLAVAALCVAVSVTVGVGVMVGSFRGTVIVWLEQSLPGDIQLTVLSESAMSEGLPGDLLSDIANMDTISAIHFSVLDQVETEFGPVVLGVNDIPGEDKFLMKEIGEDGFSNFNLGQGVFISEPLGYLQQLTVNDTISVLTDTGMMDFPVLGIFYDYTSGTGMVHMHASGYDRHWNLEPYTRVTLDITPGSNADLVVSELEVLLSSYESNFNVVANSQLRELTLQIFDRTFAITNVLRLLAILVAFVGVVSTLMALQLEKAREFAILRSTGMTTVQTSGLIMKQTILLGLCAGILAIPLGLMMSDILIDVINRRSFGWTMQHFLPESVLLEGIMLAVIAAVLAGIYPAWRVARIRPAMALREE